ncbi:hypothetical protein C0Q70_14163 [Pomacea canaliculata]|uniref:Probable RNA-binding protein EIF1AD n=1 Tax=Pomacea canaliculata TaxID=400727 RepID=A0A2T7NZC0_POMCA|nr:probable RNA-binding protein EIF1AD [Pomacea canaliculata]PVD26486.1 hypothetical protein C0Q70_14163 [Pomacea canaliculata]
MSRITKRKHVVREVLDEYVLPSGKQDIVRVLGGRGNNLHEVEDPTGTKYLVSMPTKFRKNVWIKRGDFVIVEPIEEGEKVRAEIVHILLRDHIRHIQDQGLWPALFQLEQQKTDCYVQDDMLPPSDSEGEEDLGLKVINTNRRQVEDDDSSDEEDLESEKEIDNSEVENDEKTDNEKKVEETAEGENSPDSRITDSILTER